MTESSNMSADFFKRLLNQISGKATSRDTLIPEYCITGSGGYIWCYDPSDRTMKQIARGTKVFVIQEDYDYNGRTLVYTSNGVAVCIEPEELIFTGFD